MSDGAIADAGTVRPVDDLPQSGRGARSHAVAEASEPESSSAGIIPKDVMELWISFVQLKAFTNLERAVQFYKHTPCLLRSRRRRTAFFEI